MAYTKQTWSTGNVVTAAKMNNIEQGIYDANQNPSCLLLQFAEIQAGTIDTGDGLTYYIYPEVHGVTWQNVFDAMTSGTLVYTVGYIDANSIEGYMVYLMDYININEEDPFYPNYTHSCADSYNSVWFSAIGANGVLTKIVAVDEK